MRRSSKTLTLTSPSGRGAGRADTTLALFKDVDQYTVKKPLDVGIQKSQHEVSISFDPDCPASIVLLPLVVRLPVQFKHQPRFVAVEVRDIRPERMLPPEL